MWDLLTACWVHLSSVGLTKEGETNCVNITCCSRILQDKEGYVLYTVVVLSKFYEPFKVSVVVV